MTVHREPHRLIVSSNEKQAATNRGFTLIELMVVISIIAILAAVGLVVYSSVQKTGRISKRLQDLAAIRTAIELFKASTGFYPSIAGTTAVCVDQLSGSNALAPTYMPVVPRDPIQSIAGGTNCYRYISNTTGAVPTATEYKIKTDVGTAEMIWTDYNQQPTLLDPAHDGNIGSGSTACNLDPLTANVTGQAWAYYTTASVTCLY